MVFKNIYHIGDTKSAQELEVFLRMPRERLRLCCRIQCTDSLHPNGPRQRRKLFTAALKLLRFAIGIETVCCENEEQRALQTALCEKPEPLRFKLIFSMTYVTQSTNPSTMCTNTLETKNCNYLTTLGLPVFSRNPWLHSVSQHFCSAHTVR